MAEIIGTTGNDPALNGTGDADTITALAGNDVVNAGAGNDIINGGTGNDTLNGEDGDDTFIEDQFTSPTDIFNGGIGFDTIELRVAPVPIVTTLGSSTFHSLSGTGQMVSIERIVFASQAGQTVQASLGYSNWQASGLTQIVGGAGRDFIAVGGITIAGTYTMPALPVSAFDPISLNAWEHTGDFVVLTVSTAPGSTYTLNALAGASFFQILAGGAGNDTLNGSSNADTFDARLGGDQINAGDGNDAILMINSSTPGAGFWNTPSFNTGAGGIWDGGNGIDVISIGGLVDLQATLLNIEGVHLQPAFTPPAFNTIKQDAAVVTLHDAHVASLPSNAFFSGTGTVGFSLVAAASFSAAGYTFTPGSTVTLEIHAPNGDGLTFTGSTNGDRILLSSGTQAALGGDGNDFIALSGGTQTAIGGNGDDLIAFGVGTQTATGGAGADRFSFGIGACTVTDFTQGLDKIDLSDTDIYNLGRLNDILTVYGSGETIAVPTTDGTYQLTFQGVAVSSLTANDVLLGSNSGQSNTEFGTAASELIVGASGNDELHGGDGNDRIYSGGGIDKLYGDGGDDTIVLDGMATQFGTVVDGGAGTDTLILRPADNAVSGGPATGYTAMTGPNGTGLTGIESVLFESTANFALNLITTFDASFGQATGGAGTDGLVFIALAPGTYTLPNFTLSNWSANDFVVLFVPDGNSSSVTLNGRNDLSQIIVARLGADTLNGGALADKLFGGGNNDTLNGNGGADELYGEAGNDRLVVSNNGIKVDGGTEIDTLAVSGSVSSFTSIVGMEAIDLIGGASLTLTSAQFASGFASNSVLGGSGAITVNMALGSQTVDASNMTLAGGASLTLAVNGSTGNDTIRLGAGTQSAIGGAGNDSIQFGVGTQFATGGAGADLFSIGVGAGTVTDFVVGEDKIDLSDSEVFNLSRLNDILTLYSNGDTISVNTLDDAQQPLTHQLTLQGVPIASLTASDFVLGTDTGGSDLEIGTAAAEFFAGGSGNDEYHGGDGADRFYAGGGVNLVFGDGGDDTIILDSVIDPGGTYDGGSGIDTLLLRTNSASVANGPATQYSIFPGAPGTGLVSVEKIAFDSSASYALTLITTTAPGITEAIGGAGVDTLVFVATSAGTYSMPAFTLTNWSANDSIGMSAQAGSIFDVTFNGRNDIGQFLTGQGGNDTLNGGVLVDVLRGGAGNDALNGGGGADQLFGEAGNDRLVVANNGVFVDGGANTDTLAVSGTVNSFGGITGMEAIDLVGGASLTLTGAQVSSGFVLTTAVTGSGSLTINMTAGLLLGTKFWTIAPGIAVTINGTSGTDIMKLGNVVQTVNGGDGTDQIKGGSQVDTINGGAGIDKIMGLGGADILTGGIGNDVFRYLAQGDSGTGAGADRITDFAIGQDKLNFKDIDADAVTAGDQAFTFLGNAAFGTPGTGQIRYQDSGADLLVQVDVNGDGTADMEVILQGLSGQALAAGSFVL